MSAEVAWVHTTGQPRTDSLLSDLAWKQGAGTTTITYSFAASAGAYAQGYGGGEPAAGFAAFGEAQKAAARLVLERWAAVADIRFVEVDESGGTVGTIRFARTAVSPTAHAYLPDAAPEGGDIWLGPYFGADASYAPGTYRFATLLHEIGHALGLKHPHDRDGSGVVLGTRLDWLGTSVMSYRSFPGDGLVGGYRNELYPSGPMLHDVRAIQHLYGAATATASGDTVYAWAPGERIFATIYDAGGTDTLDWSNQTSAAVIDLAPGAWSRLGPAYTWIGGRLATTLAIAEGTVIENADGGSGADTLLGNAVGNRLVGRDGNDRLDGRVGDDFLDGGAGKDVLRGGSGADTLEGGPGSDQIFGDAGADVCRFTGVAADFQVTVKGRTWLVRDLDPSDGDLGQDRLTGIETLVFDDATIDLPAPGRQGLLALGLTGATVSAEALASHLQAAAPAGEWLV